MRHSTTRLTRSLSAINFIGSPSDPVSGKPKDYMGGKIEPGRRKEGMGLPFKILGPKTVARFFLPILFCSDLVATTIRNSQRYLSRVAFSKGRVSTTLANFVKRSFSDSEDQKHMRKTQPKLWR